MLKNCLFGTYRAPATNSSSSYERRGMGARSISPRISPNLNLDRSLQRGRSELQLRHIPVYDSSSARVAARGPVAHQKPLGVSRGYSILPWHDIPARCEIQLCLTAQRPYRESGFSRRCRMSMNEFRDLAPQLFTERQAAKRLGHSLSTLRRWLRAGRGPTFFRFGRMVLYRLEDLEEFVTAHVIKQGQPS